MGLPVLILGESGSGKSTSLRNFKGNEIGVMNVAGKPLPFKSDIKPYSVSRVAKQKGFSRYDVIKSAIKNGKVKTYVIDDSQYLLAFDSFDHAKDVGYGKFTDRDEFVKAFTALYMEQVVPCIERGLCAAVYTQVSDVEDETNGLRTYDRAVEKVKPQEAAPITAALKAAMEKSG